MRKTHRVTLPSKQKTKVVKKKSSTTAKAKKKKQQPAKPKQPQKKEQAAAPSARANRMQLKNATVSDAKSLLEEKKQILNHRRKLLAYVRMSRTAAEERVNNLSDEECKQLEAVADPLEDGDIKNDDASLEEPTSQNPQSSTAALAVTSSTNVELTTTKRPEELTKNEKHLKHQAALQNAATSKAKKKKKTKKKKEKKTSTNRGITQRPSGKWQAQIFYAGKSRYLGVYDTEQAAALSFSRASAFLQNLPETTNKVQIENNVKLARTAAKTIGAL